MISPSDKDEKELLAGATLTGARHVSENTCSQDAILYRKYPFGTILAVADGVGSDLYSQFGSESVVKAVHSVFVDLASGLIEPKQIADCIVERYVDSLDKDYREKAATTCIYAARIYGMGLYLGQVGDGICCGRINDVEFILLQKHDDFTNLVIPLSAARGTSEWTEAFLPEDQIHSVRLMLATDGVSEDILPGKECAFSDYIIARLSELSVEKREKYLLQTLQDWSTPRSSDDKTFCFYSSQKAED